MAVLKPVAAGIGLLVAGLVLAEVMGLLMLRHSISAYKRYWDTQNVRQSDPRSILYIALGDSTAQGIGASKPENGYVGLVKKALETKYNQPVHVVNLSMSGATLQSLLDNQLPKLQQMNIPQNAFVTVEIGANDMDGFDASNFESQIKQVFSKLPSQTVVSDMPYFGGGRKRNLETNVLKANEIISKVAKEYSLRLAPLHHMTASHDGILTMSADLLHPSDRGYRNWYLAFAEGLNI